MNKSDLKEDEQYLLMFSVNIKDYMSVSYEEYVWTYEQYVSVRVQLGW